MQFSGRIALPAKHKFSRFTLSPSLFLASKYRRGSVFRPLALKTAKGGRARIVRAKKKDSFRNFWDENARSWIVRGSFVMSLTLSLLLGSFPVRAWQNPDAGGAAPSEQQQTGRISGKIVDPSGAPVPGVKVRLSGQEQTPALEVLTDDAGQFAFANIVAGPFHLTIAAAGFAVQEFVGNLSAQENFVVPQISLALAAVNTEVRVVPSTVDVAEDQIKIEEKQRALKIIPNFYVTYVPNAAPLAPKQKFELAWKYMFDPITFGLSGAIAGLQQAQNDFSGYGQGGQGFAKRYAAAYGDMATSTLIGSAILPSLLKQDPRYFYKGTGSKRSRVLYAIANSVICKGDNGHWQANYSGILGGLASGGISNLYYPARDRDAALTFQNFAIGLGATAAANILQEFVIRRFTSNVPRRDPGNSGKPPNQISRVFGSLIHEGN